MNNTAVLFDDAVQKQKTGNFIKYFGDIVTWIAVNNQVDVAHWQIGVGAVAAIVLDLLTK